MKTAVMATSTHLGVMNTGSAAVEMAVDAYATRVLQMSTPPETFFDTSLGPYVTSVLRCSEIQSLPPDSDVASLAEFDSLLELLEDQCNMEHDVAAGALKRIAEAVVTGVVPHQESSSSSPPKGSHGGGLYSLSGGNSLDSFQSMKTNLPVLHTQKLEQPSIDPYTPNSAGGPSPLKPDNLIPLDLLGFLDEPSPHKLEHHQQRALLEHYQEQRPMGNIPATTADMVQASAKFESSHVQEDPKTTSNRDESFPPLGAVASGNSSKPPSSRKARGKTKGSSKSKNSDKELAAALFRPSRPRLNSFETEESSPPLSSIVHHPGGGFTEQQHSQMRNQFFQQQIDSCVEILLSMNTDLSEPAAMEAAIMANADFNIAHYIVDKAMSAPPVCRHMLHDGCYRSDCQFSHDVEGHTCLFWLRGRCTKPVSVCKFLHGFHPKLMEGIPAMAAPASNSPTVDVYAPSYAPPGLAGFVLSPSGNPMMQSWQQHQQVPSLADSSASYSSSAGSTSNGGSSYSFATIASQGYGKHQYTSPLPPLLMDSSSSASSTQIPIVRIPQDLWNPHENRDASVFFVADPMERYRQVCATNGNRREDVIDLHFQSTKTFAAVLDIVLPSKLQSASSMSSDGGIWIVTGTGHHVGSKTHQKGGGALERAVMQWLQEHGYVFARGKDRNGLGGAVLVKR